MTEMLEIVEPGLQTTVQDLGRYGYQRFGVPVSGAIDTFALRAANILAGNERGAAGLEITVLGPKIRFLAGTQIAITGGDLSPSIDGEPVPQWRTVTVETGSELSFGGPQNGLRSWLAVAGGINVPLVMRSRSTYVRGGIGGLDGRALVAGDILSTLESERALVDRKLPEDFSPPVYGHDFGLRVVLGPQDGAFTEAALASFVGATYSVSMDQDRMGCRLEGPVLEHSAGPDIVSDGSPMGGVQVPGDGAPIILLADRGATGGFAKIATVIGADVGLIAQAMPGDMVEFHPLAVDEAQAALREQHAVLSAIERGVQRMVEERRMGIRADGKSIEVLNESGAPITLPGGPNGAGSAERRSVRATVDGASYDFEVEFQVKD